jgi:hypothetical protein
MVSLLRRLAGEQDVSLQAMTEGKTVGSRLGGYTRGERVESKFFLLALAPFCVLIVADGFGWELGIVGEVWMWLSIAWSVLVIGYMLAAFAKTTKKLAIRADERFDSKGKFLLPPEYRAAESATKAKRSRKRRK